jgi:ligand-binding sensor domain-containing protein/signal transduction histidine kinase
MNNKSWHRLLIILLLSLPGSLIVYSQERTGNFIAYSSLLGLSNGLNYHVCESQDGFLWIATGNGLIRFDGKHYQRILAGPGSITDNFVVDVAEDSRGDIWIAGFTKGLSRFINISRTYRAYPVIGNGNTELQTIFKILPASDGRVWFGTRDMGLALYIPEQDTFRFFTPDEWGKNERKNGDASSLTDIVEDPQNPGILWLTLGPDIYSFNTRTLRFTKEHYISDYKPSQVHWLCIAHDGNNGLYLGGWAIGMNYYNLTKKKITPLPFTYKNGKEEKGAVTMDVGILNDSTILWACSLSGMMQYNPVTGKMKTVSPTPDVGNSIAKQVDFQSVSVTKNGGCFIGATGFVFQMHPGYSRLGNILVPEPSQINEGIYISNILTDENEENYYLAGAGPSRFMKINSSTMKSEEIQINIPDKSTGIQDIIWRSKQEILACGFDGNLYRYNTNGKKSDGPFKGMPKRIKGIEKDSRSFIWMMTSKALYQMDPSSLSIRDSFLFPSGKEKKRGKPLYLFQLISDSRGRAWVGSSNGIWMADPQSKELKHWSPDNQAGQWLRHHWIKSMGIDDNDMLWIGYNGQGLQAFDTRTLRINQMIENADIPVNQVNDIEFTRSGLLVATTTEGLFELDPGSLEWQLYGVSDGLSDQYLDGGIISTADGRLFVTHNTFLNYFHENDLDIYQENMKINITSLKINDKDLNLAGFQKSTSYINLPYEQNNLSISFAAMQWVYPWKTKYSYRFFSGSDTTGWLSLDDPVINLSGMKPGIYTLQFKAIGAGNTLSWPKQILIEITPPFWQRLWFIFLMNALLISGIYGLYRFRLVQMRKPLEIRNSISKNLHDDIGSSLSNIRILTELAKRNLSVPEKAGSFLEKSAEDIQRVSEALSDIVWNVSPKYDDLQNLFIRMKRYAADSLEGKQIHFELDFPENASDLKMKMEKRRDFYLIFKESIHNLIKYSGATDATVKVNIGNACIRMEISDNGIGFDPESVKSGNGIENMHQRAFSCKGELNIMSATGKGTKLVFEMPLE